MLDVAPNMDVHILSKTHNSCYIIEVIILYVITTQKSCAHLQTLNYELTAAAEAQASTASADTSPRGGRRSGVRRWRRTRPKQRARSRFLSTEKIRSGLRRSELRSSLDLKNEQSIPFYLLQQKDSRIQHRGRNLKIK